MSLWVFSFQYLKIEVVILHSLIEHCGRRGRMEATDESAIMYVA